jgi:choice-of-anchor B domain-containing protein
MRSSLFLTLGAVLGALASGTVLAHDDDPKILDRELAYRGPGFRRSLLDQPDSSMGGGNQAVGGFDANGVTLLSWIPLSDMAGNPSSGADCWGYTSPSGREYALMAQREGLTVVEITAPSAPVIIAELPGPSSLWRDVKTFQDKAYSVSEGGSGIQIFDLAQIDSGNVTQVGSVTSGGTSSTHNVAINTDSGYLYRTGGDSNGLRIYNLNASLTNPPLVQTWSTRYVHDAQVVSYTSGPYAGKEIAFCCSGFNGGWDGTGLDILDVTNKNNITVLDNLVYSGGAYSHQGWLSEDRQYFYLGDELDENGSLPTTTHVIDVSNLSNAVKVGTFTNGNQAVGHNIYTLNGLIYQANYRSGLRIFDGNVNATNPPEIAHFDTYPGSNSDSFNGLWSVYPYFPSGTVIGSDLERGLFIWQVGDAPIEISLPQGDPELVDPGGADVAVFIAESQPGNYVPGSGLLHVGENGNWSSIPLSHQGGSNYMAHFPSLPCATNFEFYLTATDQGGNVWSYPVGAPGILLEAQSGFGVAIEETDDMEAPSGWTSGYPGDDASTGIWTRVDPVGTGSQPELDHTTGSASICWVTGQGSVGGSLGENDVDDGKTTLVTPAYDMSGYAAPAISYWRWYSNSGNSAVDDEFVVEISGNGSNWVEIERIGGSSGQASGGWYKNQVYVQNHISLTSTVQLRFIASDEGSGSIVEAAIDDLQITDVDCGGCDGTPVSNYCTSSPNSVGPGAVAGYGGSTSLAANDLSFFAFGLPPNVPGLFFYGPTQAALPFGEGVRCVDGTLVRLTPQFSDTVGEVNITIDFTAPPFDSGPGFVTAGDVRNFQYWYRDNPGGPSGFNTSDAMEVQICP